MNPLFLAIRAISSEFARRLFLPLVWIIGSTAVALIIVVGWLTTLSGWWWILLVPVIICLIVFIIASTTVGVAIHILQPTQTKQQRKSVSSLVDKLQHVAETLQMPKILIIARLAKDTIFPSKDGFIGEITSHATTLKPDFQAIVASYK